MMQWFRRTAKHELWDYPTLGFLHYIVTRRTAPFPLGQYQIYRWTVSSLSTR
jgi:hypothetical protein